MQCYCETGRRSVVKAMTFRVLAICAHTIIIYAVTRRADFTVGLVLLTNLASTVLYYFHERLWNRIVWGRANAPVRSETDVER